MSQPGSLGMAGQVIGVCAVLSPLHRTLMLDVMMRVAGIMSGTSLDGIDVAVLDIARTHPRVSFRVVAAGTVPYRPALRQAILAATNCVTHVSEISRLSFLLPELYAAALASVCQKAGTRLDSIQLVGCHGQTIYHEGAGAKYLGRRVANTLQIGDGCVLAERLRAPVVTGFRSRDIAAGGQGAPLVPLVDYLLFRDERRGRVALNLGGIANLTAIPPGADPSQVIAFDTGPANMVIDEAMRRTSDGSRHFDRNGALAARGVARTEWVREALRLPYFRKKPPKSAGREQFGDEFTSRLLRAAPKPADAVATATLLSASSVADAIRRFVLPAMPVHEVVVSGGGAHNRTLLALLRQKLPEVEVRLSSEFGIDVDAKEAIAFALLAYESFHGRPGNLPSATGARRPVILGKLSLPGDRP